MATGRGERLEAQMTEFTAAIAGECEENEVYTIAVAEGGEPGERTSFSFQWTDNFGEQEIRLGWDTYCICRDPHQMAHYGGALAWGLKDRVLVVRLDDTASGNLEVEGGFRFDLSGLDEGSVKMLEQGLTRVLVGVPRDDRAVDDAAG